MNGGDVSNKSGIKCTGQHGHGVTTQDGMRCQDMGIVGMAA